VAETIGVEIGRQTKAVELVPDRRAYDALVRSFLLRRRFGEAKRHTEAMVAMGTRPMDATYHMWLSTLVRRRKWGDAKTIMQVRECVRVRVCVSDRERGDARQNCPATPT